MELDLHGGGIDARGAAFPGVSLRRAGRPRQGLRLERDLGQRRHRGRGRGDALRRATPGTSIAGSAATWTSSTRACCGARPAQPDERIVFRQTVHGPGDRVCDRRRRARRDRRAALDARTRGAERAVLRRPEREPVDSAQPRFCGRRAGWSSRSTGCTRTTATSRSSRAAGCRCVRPTRRSRPAAPRQRGLRVERFRRRSSGHPQVINPPGGAILNWNNRPARGFAAADDEWSWGSVQRVELLDRRDLGARTAHACVRGRGDERARRRRTCARSRSSAR